MNRNIAGSVLAAAIAIALPIGNANAQSVVCNISGSNNPCSIEATIVGSIAVNNSTVVNSKRVVIIVANKPKHGWSIHQSNPKHAPCWCSDDPMDPPGPNHGWMTPYSTPLGYSPIGPVSVYCPDQSDHITDSLQVRAW